MGKAIITDGLVEPLLHERSGYARRLLADRVAEVDEQLDLRGYDATDRKKAGLATVEQIHAAAEKRAAAAPGAPNSATSGTAVTR